MNISKIFYIFNYLLIINLLIPHFCNNNLELSKILNSSVEVHSESKKKKERKIIFYSSIVTALIISIAFALRIGIYAYEKRKSKSESTVKENLKNDVGVPLSVWDNKYLGRIATDVMDEALEKGEQDVKRALKQGILDEKKIIPSLETIKEYMRIGTKERFVNLTESQMNEIESMAHYCLYNIKFVSLPRQIRDLSLVPELE